MIDFMICLDLLGHFSASWSLYILMLAGYRVSSASEAMLDEETIPYGEAAAIVLNILKVAFLEGRIQ